MYDGITLAISKVLSSFCQEKACKRDILGDFACRWDKTTCDPKFHCDNACLVQPDAHLGYNNSKGQPM